MPCKEILDELSEYQLLRGFSIIESDLCKSRIGLECFALPAEICLLFDCNTRLNMKDLCKYTSFKATDNIKIDELIRLELQSKNACKYLYLHRFFVIPRSLFIFISAETAISFNYGLANDQNVLCSGINGEVL
jgi:hypothetical protein